MPLPSGTPASFSCPSPPPYHSCDTVSRRPRAHLHEGVVSELRAGQGGRGAQEAGVGHLLHSLSDGQHQGGVDERHDDVSVEVGCRHRPTSPVTATGGVRAHGGGTDSTARDSENKCHTGSRSRLKRRQSRRQRVWTCCARLAPCVGSAEVAPTGGCCGNYLFSAGSATKSQRSGAVPWKEQSLVVDGSVKPAWSGLSAARWRRRRPQRAVCVPRPPLPYRRGGDSEHKTNKIIQIRKIMRCSPWNWIEKTNNRLRHKMHWHSAKQITLLGPR